MNSNEIKNELKMSYNKLVEYLLKKYGPAPCDYFCNSLCKSRNKKIGRGDEGLICHHIDEDKAIMLSTPKFAILNPFEYQRANRLVYCNVLEHLILHCKIAEEPKNKNANKLEIQGIGGAINFLIPQINDYFDGYEFKKQCDIKAYDLIKNNFDDYIDILKYFLNIVKINPIYKKYVSKENLCKRSDNRILKKIYNKL